MVNISIIMPIYNTAEYIRKSIGSIQQQTYADYELICVNDASTDDSLSILQEIQSQDKRIIIVDHEVNCGAAVSRNDGLKIAQGDYIICLDSDDYFYSNLLEDLYRQAVKYDADIVIFGSEMIEKRSHNLIQSCYKFQFIDSLEKKTLFLPKCRHVSWDKLIKRKLLIENSITFQNVLTNNDVFFSLASMLMAEKIVVYDEILLRYYDGRPGNLTEIRFFKQNHTVDAFYAVYLFCIRRNVDHRLREVFMNMLADNIQMYLSEAVYPYVMREQSRKALMQHRDLIRELCLRAEAGSLYPHNQNFVRRLTGGEDVCHVDYISYYAQSLEEIILKKKVQAKKVALWGCGINGKKLLNLMEEKNIAIDYVVDENKQIQGNMYKKYRIYSFDEKMDDIDIVLITNLEYKQEIEKRAKGKEVIYVWK